MVRQQQDVEQAHTHATEMRQGKNGAEPGRRPQASGLLVVLAWVDPLTAFLANSSGGADFIAIIAASIQADEACV